MMQTVWSDADSFLDGFYGKKKDEKGGDNTHGIASELCMIRLVN